MTGRLLARCSRLLSRAHGGQAAASSVAAPRLAVGAPLSNGLNGGGGAAAVELLRPRGGGAPSWPPRAPPGRPLCDRRPASAAFATAAFPVETVPKRTRLDDLLDQATTPEDVLQAWAQSRGDGNHAALTIVKVARLQRAAKGKGQPATDANADLLSDPRMRDMMVTVTGQVSRIWHGALVNLQQALRTLGSPSGPAALATVQTELLWRIRRLSTKNLALLVDWAGGREDALSVAALKQLELRWTEISDVKTVGMLMSHGRHMSPTLMDRLEDKALELAESFSTEDIRWVCLSLAYQSRRSVPLLRALSYHLLQKPLSELGTPLLLDMAYVYGKLNFQHAQVLQRMSSELLPRVPELSPADVTRCAKSLGFLKWLHYPLFEAFAENYIANSVKYSTSQLCNLIMTFARLGFQPTKSAEFFHQVHGALDDASLPTLEPFLQTDVVWSLCVLQQAKTSYLPTLTQHAHIAKVTGGDPSKGENYRKRLLQIAATLHLEHPPSSSSSSSSEPAPISPLLAAEARNQSAAPLSPLQTSLEGALQSLVGERKGTLRTAVNTVYGWTIDGEMVVDGENRPINCLSTSEAPHLAKGKKVGQSLPAGARRLAFVAWEFPNFGSRSKELLGLFVMKRRHLQLAGFTVVEVPYYEWMELKSDWQRLAYLRDKIGKAVAEDMAK